MNEILANGVLKYITSMHSEQESITSKNIIIGGQSMKIIEVCASFYEFIQVCNSNFVMCQKKSTIELVSALAHFVNHRRSDVSS